MVYGIWVEVGTGGEDSFEFSFSIFCIKFLGIDGYIEAMMHENICIFINLIDGEAGHFNICDIFFYFLSFFIFDEDRYISMFDTVTHIAEDASIMKSCLYWWGG